MKKIYQAPALEIELYQLDASIAGNCSFPVAMGPEGPGAVAVCKDYYDKTGEPGGSSAGSSSKSASAYNIDFWTADSCYCYYTANGSFFTS